MFGRIWSKFRMHSPDNGKWYCAGLHFQCLQCGNCCGGFPGYVWVTPAEGENIAEFLGVSLTEFHNKFTVKVRSRRSLSEQSNYDCIFLRRQADGGRCAIYPVRPQQCRTWPFWKRNLTTPDAWNELANRCAGINRGKNYTYEEIEAILLTSPC